MKSSTGWLELSKLASSQKIGLHSNGTLLTSFDLYFLLLDDSNETPQRMFFTVITLSDKDLFKAIGFQTAPPILTTLTVITYGTIDAFAVLAPIGPLRRISGKAHEYSDQVSKAITSQLLDIISIKNCDNCLLLTVLRFLMFTAEDRNDERREEIEAKSKHIQQRKALGHKSNICDETIRKICTKLGTSENKRKKRNLKSTML
uniref:Uncharacterized protein n=1 Tax=Brugia malayi TaxID=6279 RepID=A8PB37_BRUMA